MEPIEREDSNMPAGERGGRDIAPTRLFGDEESMQTGSDEETERESSLGSGEGIEEASNLILPERGDIDGNEMVAIRGLLSVLRRRMADLAVRSRQTTFLDDEWWECINEIEVVGNTIEALRRTFVRN